MRGDWKSINLNAKVSKPQFLYICHLKPREILSQGNITKYLSMGWL